MGGVEPVTVPCGPGAAVRAVAANRFGRFFRAPRGALRSGSRVKASNSSVRVFQLPVMAFNSSVAMPAWMYSSVTPGLRLASLRIQ